MNGADRAPLRVVTMAWVLFPGRKYENKITACRSHLTPPTTAKPTTTSPIVQGNLHDE